MAEDRKRIIDYPETTTVGDSDYLLMSQYNESLNAYESKKVLAKKVGGNSKKAYLKSSGTQYINTGVKASNDTSIMVTFFLDLDQYNPAENWVNPFCGCDSNTVNSCTFGYNQTSNELTFQFGGTFGNPNLPIAPYAEHRVGIVKGNTFFDSHSYARWDITTQFESAYNIALFAGNYGGTVSNFAKICMTGCKIWDGNTLIRDFIPTVDDNNEACMVDLLTGTYYKNLGSGNFVYGES